jgi:hypothetical protein
MTATKLALAAAIALALGAAALPRARAADEGAKLARHAYPELGFEIDVPPKWSETPEKSGVKWELEDKAWAFELTFQSQRKALDSVEQNLTRTAELNKWTIVEGPTRITIDDCPATRMLVEIPRRLPQRELFTVIDEPQGTYLLTYGDLATDFDRPAFEAIVATFHHIPIAAPREAASGPTPTATPPPAPTPSTAGGPLPTEVQHEWGCPACNKIWPRGDKFCRDCGGKNGPLPVKVWGCASCKKLYQENEKFCPDCGSKLGFYMK